MRHLVWVLLLWPAQERPRPGLVGEYFNVGNELRDFPFLPADKKPLLRRIDPRVAWEETDQEFAETGLWDYFYARWAGILRAPVDGGYDFHLQSDDGSRLWIDGKLLIDNGGLHATVEKTGRVELKAGDHEIKVELFENDDKAGIKLSWRPPEGEKELVPASALFHRRDPGLDR